MLNKTDSTGGEPIRPVTGRSEHRRAACLLSTSSATEAPEVVPFRRIDTAVLKPFASLLGLQSRNSRRQPQVQELSLAWSAP